MRMWSRIEYESLKRGDVVHTKLFHSDVDKRTFACELVRKVKDNWIVVELKGFRNEFLMSRFEYQECKIDDYFFKRRIEEQQTYIDYYTKCLKKHLDARTELESKQLWMKNVEANLQKKS